MISFWLAAGVLLLAALTLLLMPLVRGRRAQAEEDRTALNVALYQERIAELDTQHAAGALTAEQLAAGRDEAARELLADAERSEDAPAAPRTLGRTIPLLLTLLVPASGLALYLHWGASDAVALRMQLAVPPQNVEEIVERLEATVKLQPDQAEAWYFLGRAYMSQQRPNDAANAFASAVKAAGREPALLGQWAQALFFGGNRKLTDEIKALGEEALRGDPQESTTLGVFGVAAFEEERFVDAVRYWSRLVESLPADDPSRGAIQGGIEQAKARLTARGETLPEAPAAPAAVAFRVSVSLAPELVAKVQPTDSVFVFARAMSGPPMPLAVKRFTVADLPNEVSLSDADAMMPQLKLSNFPEVKLMARVSRAGTPTAGEWVGELLSVKTSEGGAKTLQINKADSSAKPQ